MLKLKTDLKKIYIFSQAIFIFLIILTFVIFFLSLQNHIINNYLIKSKTDAIFGSKAHAFQEIFHLTIQFFALALLLLILSIIFALLTFNLYFTKLFKRLRQAFLKVKEGDFDTRIPATGPLEIANLYDDFNQMVKACQKAISIKHYVSSSTKKMVEILNTGEITTQPRRKLVTAFFSDIRGFSSFAEEQDPLVVINTLNEIFAIQIEIIRRHSGDIDKFIGDEIMAEFPDPSSAFKCANLIQEKIKAYNFKKSKSLEVGIGINYGEAIVGAVGANDQFNWTMVGHTVNVARHLCSIAEAGEIVVSHSVYQEIKTKKKARTIEIKMKGLSKPLKGFVF